MHFHGAAIKGTRAPASCLLTPSDQLPLPEGRTYKNPNQSTSNNGIPVLEQAPIDGAVIEETIPL